MIRILDLEAADFDFESKFQEEGLDSELEDVIDYDATVRVRPSWARLCSSDLESQFMGTWGFSPAGEATFGRAEAYGIPPRPPPPPPPPARARGPVPCGLTKKCSIHRVPHCFRRHSENAYEPQIISIGPFHYKKREELQFMEGHKQRYRHDILRRNGGGEEYQEACLVAIKNLEKEARRCYYEKVELDSSTFVEMMVLDGLFIIELFRRAGDREYGSDPIFKLGWLRRTITVDLLMLENQIPFFILERLCSVMGIYKDSENVSLMKSFFSFIRPGITETNAKFPGSTEHLLHLFHCVHLLSSEKEEDHKPPKVKKVFRDLLHRFDCGHLPSPEEEGRTPKLEVVPNISKLQGGGIKFRKVHEVFKINFRGGVVEIPPLLTEEANNSVLLNLVAFEQCYRYCKSYFSGYMYFMDCLIDNAKDVEILCENGIIDPWLSSNEELAALFNKMGKEVTVYDRDSHLQNVCNKINQYCRDPWHKWKVSLMQNYFNNPWAIISVIAATVLLVFTITQTFFTAFPKFAPGKQKP